MKKKRDRKVSIKIGDRFGEWTVLSRAEDHATPSRRSHCWNCVCSCGTSKVVIGSNLIGKRTKHCGCIKRKSEKTYPLNCGDKFNRLTLISYIEEDDKWVCQCDCGKKVTINRSSVYSGNTKSCGCLMLESRKKKALLMQAKRTKYPANVASARRVWKRYKYEDPNCDITFEQWMELSQSNCSYCGTPPSIKYNYFDHESSRSNKKRAMGGEFSYNGLDRIDSGKYHTIDNVVPCCYICNRNKNNLSVEKFLERVAGLKTVSFQPLELQELQIATTNLKTSVKPIYLIYKQDSDLTLEEFYWLSQQPCYYCGCKSSNFCNKYLNDKRSSQAAKDNSNFHYNGLDRVDSNRGHAKDNVVPCCRYCNFGKGKMSLEDWSRWIERVTGYQDEKSKLNR